MYIIIRGEINWNVMLDITRKEGSLLTVAANCISSSTPTQNRITFQLMFPYFSTHARATSPTPVAALLNLTFAIV